MYDTQCEENYKNKPGNHSTELRAIKEVPMSSNALHIFAVSHTPVTVLLPTEHMKERKQKRDYTN
jgi:hypothetical protein